ncbi:MAG: hypothetical protein GYA16_01595 [Spirochaetes bacterium]|nr:hypothetical protein [Spirochaetota bacterium]NMB63542.1 hypothetical protein [Spirochaetota bacterium]
MKSTRFLLYAIVALLALSLCLVANAQQQAPKGDQQKEAIKEEVTGWRIKDFKPYVKAIQELEKLSKEYSDNLLKLAIDEYSTGIDILEDMDNDVNKLIETNQKNKNLQEQWYWQEIDRREQEKRQIAMMKFEAKTKAVTYFTRAINHMDEITFEEVRKDPKFVNFQIRLYQAYVSTQYDLYNLKPCIPILERYIEINDQTKNDVWAYKYLSSCYGYMEGVLLKYKQGTEQEQLQYKQKKNMYMLRAAELQYGIDSPQYKHLREIVSKDEKKSEKINEFK